MGRNEDFNAFPPTAAAEQETKPSTESPGTTVAEPKKRSDSRVRLERLWYVILHDDQLHTYQYVIEMLMKLFNIDAQRALLHAIEVDTAGVTIVARLPKEKAEQKRDEIMSYGGDPWMKTTVSMKASIEPCDD